MILKNPPSHEQRVIVIVSALLSFLITAPVQYGFFLWCYFYGISEVCLLALGSVLFLNQRLGVVPERGIAGGGIGGRSSLRLPVRMFGG